jgi:hypothetical protein
MRDAKVFRDAAGTASRRAVKLPNLALLRALVSPGDQLPERPSCRISP